VGDPDYGELVPTVTAVSGSAANNDANIVLPSATLKPYYVDNYDVSVEYYFAQTGVLGGSLFRKDISGFIVSQLVPMADARVQAALSEAGLTDPVERAAAIGATPTATIRSNGKNATIQGVELWYNQNLSFLPKPFDGLNIQLNFTRTDANSSDLDTLYAAQADSVSKQINARLAYQWRKWQVAVSTNWTGEVLIQQSNLGTGVVPITVGGVAYNTLNQYKAPEIKSKFEISYTFSSRYTATFEIDNIGYRRQEYFKNYQPLAKQTQLSATQYVYGDPVVRIGVKGSF